MLPPAPPIGSLERAREQLSRGHLDKALRTLRVGGHELLDVKAEWDAAVSRLVRQRAFGPVLSAHYRGGGIGSAGVIELLRRMHAAGDHAGFLKQVLRFGILTEINAEVESSLRWYEVRGLTDASAWRRKVEKLYEQALLAEADVECGQGIDILSEDATPDGTPATYGLRPLGESRTEPRAVESVIAVASDPYVVSQAARVKLERANRDHETTLRALITGLARVGIRASESRLMDAHAVVCGRDAIFEVKSITEQNERDQVRHAISQLYEYRYLHRMRDASLWAVFACRPFSQWYVEYLVQDRDIRVLWITKGNIDGPSAPMLLLR